MYLALDTISNILSQTEALSCPIIRPQKSQDGRRVAALVLLPNPGDDQQREQAQSRQSTTTLQTKQPRSQQRLESLQPEENHWRSIKNLQIRIGEFSSSIILHPNCLLFFRQLLLTMLSPTWNMTELSRKAARMICRSTH